MEEKEMSQNSIFDREKNQNDSAFRRDSEKSERSTEMNRNRTDERGQDRGRKEEEYRKGSESEWNKHRGR